MEYLKGYNENQELLGSFSREEIHREGIWHNTIHCWVYDNQNNVYFQVRSDDNRLYTTASGHVQAEETIKEAFGRETKEEVGIKVDYEEAELIKIVKWQMDREKNGELNKDRAFANIFILNVKEEPTDFSFTDGEVVGVAKLNVKEVLDLFNDRVKEIKGIYIGKDERIERIFTVKDFLVLANEDVITKYGYIMEAINEKF